MKKLVLFFVLALFAVTSVSAQRKMCSVCHHSGWYKIPNSGYGLNAVRGTCPNCKKEVDLSGHSCPCRACNGQGYTEGSSTRSRSRRSDGSPVDEYSLYIFKCLQSNSIPVMQTCWACNGTGMCQTCNGSGLFNMMGNIEPCPVCYSTRSCKTCYGNRVIQGSRPMTPKERSIYEQALRDCMQ